MSGPRQDLLHLSPEALAQAANLGLVKRAQRELEGGKGPALELDAAGTLSALFADGTRVRWAAGQSIQEAACSCGAAGACRHRIMAALAYRSQAEAAPPPLVSPAAVSDAELAQLLPPPAPGPGPQPAGTGPERGAAGHGCRGTLSHRPPAHGHRALLGRRPHRGRPV